MTKKQVKNLVSASITAADKTAILAAIDVIKTKLPFLIALTPEERRGGFKLGDKTIPFLEKVTEYATSHPAFVPGFVSAAEMNKDFQIAKDMKDFLQLLRPLVQGMDDTQMEAGIEALWPAMSYYDSVKSAAARDVPGARAIYDDLRKRFPGAPRQSDDLQSGSGG